MANERDDEQFNETEGKTSQDQTTGQEGQQPSQQNETGQAQQSPSGQQSDGFASQPTDQSGGQTSSGQAQPSGGNDTLTLDQTANASQPENDSVSSSGEGFIGSQSSGTDAQVEHDGSTKVASSADATGGSDFAENGQGASDEIEDDSGSRDTGNTGGGGGF